MFDVVIINTIVGHHRQQRHASVGGGPHGARRVKLFAEFGDGDEITRYTAVELIGETAIEDPRAVPALLERLEHDPSQPVRLMAARGLRPLARLAAVRQALQQAAAMDEDVEIRWAARYALRLTGHSSWHPT